MHVCGSHEQAIARFGLRAVVPARARRHHGPGLSGLHHRRPEVDEARRARARRACASPPTATWCACRAPSSSLADAQAAGAQRRRRLQHRRRRSSSRATTDEPVVFFATGFETTAVATAAVILRRPAAELLGALGAQVHPAGDGDRRARCRTRASRASSPPATPRRSPAGASSSRSSRATSVPVVVAGFEPLDILAGAGPAGRADPRRHAAGRQHVPALRDARGQPARAANSCGRCSRRSAAAGAASRTCPNGNLRLRDEWAHVDARRRFTIDLAALWDDAPSTLVAAVHLRRHHGRASQSPRDCPLFGRECVPDTPVGACMVSSEGTCRIWHEYGGPSRSSEADVCTSAASTSASR